MLSPAMTTLLRPPPSLVKGLCAAVAGILFAAFAASPSRATDPAFTTVPSAHLHNVFRLSTNLLSGSSPEDRDAFAELARLGVRTIISVDGAKPDVATAHQFGIRYVHLPHGYNGISPELQVRLAKAGQALPGPIYVHCHHGKHRGPVAAAVLCLADGRWDRTTAESWLKAAGTATNYSGLYAVVRDYHRPSLETLRQVPANFPESSNVPGLVEAMVAIDQHWEHLRAIQRAGYAAPETNPDLQPAQEALMLWEHYRESQRLPEAASLGADFKKRLEAAEAQGKALEDRLRSWASMSSPDLRSQLDALMAQVGKACSECHRQFRDPSPAPALSKP
ncbi:MAG: cytochrome c [Verrucomicrobiales bacterium]|nr:cytochrome c [Verrucomicrobiales bacterium]